MGAAAAEEDAFAAEEKGLGCGVREARKPVTARLQRRAAAAIALGPSVRRGLVARGLACIKKEENARSSCSYLQTYGEKIFLKKNLWEKIALVGTYQNFKHRSEY